MNIQKVRDIKTRLKAAKDKKSPQGLEEFKKIVNTEIVQSNMSPEEKEACLKESTNI